MTLRFMRVNSRGVVAECNIHQANAPIGMNDLKTFAHLLHMPSGHG